MGSVYSTGRIRALRAVTGADKEAGKEADKEAVTEAAREFAEEAVRGAVTTGT